MVSLELEQGRGIARARAWRTVVATPCDACGNACGPDNGHSEDTVNLCRISANTRGQNRIRTLAIHVRKGLVLPRPLKRRLCCNQGGGTGNDNFLEEEHLQEIGSKHAIWIDRRITFGEDEADDPESHPDNGKPKAPGMIGLRTGIAGGIGIGCAYAICGCESGAGGAEPTRHSNAETASRSSFS
eukprot:4316918-Pleurochrysis_carterae.AAC.2